MAKGSRGGRRGGGGGGIKSSDILGTTNLLIDTALDEVTRGEVTKTLKDFQDEYGLNYNNTRIAQLKPGINALAYYDGGGIAINKSYLNSKKMNDAYLQCVKSGFHPSNGSKTGMEAVVSHELGHALTDMVGAKMGGLDIDASATRIVNEAMKGTKHKTTNTFSNAISGYANHNHAETVAEAIADCYCNGRKAKSESKRIKKVLDSYLKIPKSKTKSTTSKLTKASLNKMSRKNLETQAIKAFIKKNSSLGTAEATRRAKALMSGNTDAQLRKFIYKNQ